MVMVDISVAPCIVNNVSYLVWIGVILRGRRIGGVGEVPLLSRAM